MDNIDPLFLEEDVLKEIQEQLQYQFKSERLLQNALTHRSVKTEELPSNERLEFLGDSVLGLIAAETVYQAFPNLQEGEMTALKANWVSTDSLALCVRQKKLMQHFSLGKGILQAGQIPTSVLANGFEAILGAIYIDGGLIPAREFALNFLLKDRLKNYKLAEKQNYKTILQHLAQTKFTSLPEYKVLSETGPDHQREYRISAVIQGVTYPPGIGPSKKVAEQMAAKLALESLSDSL